MASPVKDAKNKHIANGFTEISERGKGYLRSRKPGTDQYALTTQVGNRGWHFGAGTYDETNEIDTAWEVSSGLWDYEVTKNDFHCFVRDSVPVSYRYYDVITGHYVELTVNSVEWVNDENDSEAAASFGQVTPTIDDDEIKWSDIATGWDIRVQAQTGRLAKWLDIDSLANLGSPTIGGTNIQLRLEITFQKSSGLEVWVNGVQWNEQNNTWAETSGDIEFRDETTQQSVFYFQSPTGYDSDGEVAPMSHRVRRAGANYYVEIDTPWSWLSAATFPISLDDTVNPQVAASTDDSWQTGATNDPTKTQPRIDNAGIYTGARWQVTGPASGDTVDVSYMTTYQFSATKDEVDDIDIDCVNTDSAGAFTSDDNYISGLSLTGNTVVWNPDPVDIGTGFQDGPSLVTPVQAVINREGWSSGNYLAVICVENASQINTDWQSDHYDFSSSNAPKLYIEYTATVSEKIQQSKLIRSNQIPIHQLQL